MSKISARISNNPFAHGARLIDERLGSLLQDYMQDIIGFSEKNILQYLKKNILFKYDNKTAGEMIDSLELRQGRRAKHGRTLFVEINHPLLIARELGEINGQRSFVPTNREIMWVPMDRLAMSPGGMRALHRKAQAQADAYNSRVDARNESRNERIESGDKSAKRLKTWTPKSVTSFLDKMERAGGVAFKKVRIGQKPFMEDVSDIVENSVDQFANEFWNQVTQKIWS